MKLNRTHQALLLLNCLATLSISTIANAAEPELVSAKRIWDKAAHNAFTDLTRYDDHWPCVFREGSAPDGSLLLNGAGMIPDAKIRYYSMSWLSKDGGKS